MKRTSAVAVIGGGVIGASVAYHLAMEGLTDVVILERANERGAGSTGRATGGYRAQFGTAVNVKLSLDSLERLRRFRDETGVDPGYDPVGYLWLACNDSHLEALRSAQEVQRAAGLPNTEIISSTAAASINQAVSMDGISGAAFCPTDGYIRPLEILRGYLEAGTRKGVEVEMDAEVKAIERTRAGSLRVRTTRGDVDAVTVVNAAGPLAASVARLAGVRLPVIPVRRQAAITRSTAALPASMPMTIFMDTGFHLRARDGHAVLCWPTDSSDQEASSADPEWLDAVGVMMRSRVPALAGAEIDASRCYSGLYEMSPDKHAIVGFAGECPEMFLVNGSSGHGVMHAPALGAAAAAMILDVTPAVDVSELSPGRFASGNAIATADIL
jgi:sarcosine oxidase subunit beta